jgi:hypothetical protein
MPALLSLSAAQFCLSQASRIALSCLRGFDDAFGDGFEYRCRLGRAAN